jgi:3',5'-cyclic AMP phosphodiesterase CpdA
MRTIAHISDIHFGKTDPAIVDAVISDIDAMSPSLVVVSGDLTQRARAWQYRAAAEFLSHLKWPKLVVPGNHDVPLYDVFHRFFEPLRNYRKHIAADLLPVYRDQEMLVIGLNTARSFSFRLGGFWKDGNISEEQLSDLRVQMQDIPESLFKIVVTHHPFIAPSNRHAGDIVHGAAKALETMEQCGVDILLAGHLHVGYSGDVRTHHEAVKRSILSIQAGTATSTRRRHQPNTYNRIIIDRDRVALEIRGWTGSGFSTMTTTHFARRDHAWEPQP